MSKSHVLTLGQGFTAGTIKVEDLNTGGELIIRHSVTEPHVRIMLEDEIDPLVEYANELQESIDKGKVAFTLIGKDNFINFIDDETPIFEGGVSLNNIHLTNPFLKDCALVNIDILGCKDVTIISSDIDGFYINIDVPLYIKCCYVNDQFGLDYKHNQRGQYLMNKFIPEE